jgi:muramidase (phage lysozyme)
MLTALALAAPLLAAPMDPALELAADEHSRLAWSARLSASQQLVLDGLPREASAAAHEAAESLQAALTAGAPDAQAAEDLVASLESAWTLADGVAEGWLALSERRFEDASGSAAGARLALEGLTDPGGALAAHVDGLAAFSAELAGAELALVWGDFDGAEVSAHRAAVDAWSLFLDGGLTEDQQLLVERESARLKERARAPENFLYVGARGVASLAIQNTEMVDEFSPELYAFARALTWVEGTDRLDGYFIEVGNRHFPEEIELHPGNVDVHRFKRTGYWSDAFGRFQMISTTWAAWAEAADVPVVKPGENEKGAAWYSIRPEYQDLAVLRFLQREGIEELLQEKGVNAAMYTWAAHQWASVPGASQPNGRTWRFAKVYEELLEEEQAAAAGRAGEGAPVGPESAS